MKTRKRPRLSNCRRSEQPRKRRARAGGNAGGSAAAGLRCVLAKHLAGAVGVVEPALGQRDPLARTALPAAGSAQLGDGERLGRVELGEQRVELVQGAHQRERVTQLAPGAEALEVPRHVLAELLAA